MPFTPLADRINSLPLVLCGPILRRVETNSVTVWVALKTEKKVWLEVYEIISGADLPIRLQVKLSGSRTAIRLSDNLFIVAVTAKLTNANDLLVHGKIYYYNLILTEPDATSTSPGDPDLFPESGLVPYDLHYAHPHEDFGPPHNHVHLPSFCLAPDNLNLLRIVHGSCRKAHAEGIDALPGIDDMILADRSDPELRPHYLFLTGDQFYADDVSPIMLYMLMDAEKALFGLVEYLPGNKKPALPVNGDNGNFFVGKREDKGGFTSHESNHIATAGEYMAYYLFMWSAIVWPADFPSFEEVYNDDHREINMIRYLEDIDSLTKFRDGLYEKVRRALANVPTYMIFDDHDVTDDWNMTYGWCLGVYSNTLGRRMVMNALLAYALFQDWGNSPEKYQEVDAADNDNRKLLIDAAVEWFSLGEEFGRTSILKEFSEVGIKETRLQSYLGIPTGRDANNIFVTKQNAVDPENKYSYCMIKRDTGFIRWDFRIVREKYEIIFLDGRTRRGYPVPKEEDKATQKLRADIISEESLGEQLKDISHPGIEVTMIVAPTSVIGIPAIELDNLPWLVNWEAVSQFEENVYALDVFDHWENQSRGTENLLRFLSKINTTAEGQPAGINKSRIIILTGDVHFSAVSRMQYEYPGNKSLFAQLVSSSFKKQDVKTRVLHQRGYSFGVLSAFVLGDAFLTLFPEKILGIKNWFLRFILLPVIPIFIVFHIILVIIDKLFRLLGPGFIKDWLDPKGQPPRHFLGWYDPSKKEHINHLITSHWGIASMPTPGESGSLPTLPGSGITMDADIIKLGKPTVLEKSVIDATNEPHIKYPDWQYRIDFIKALDEVREPAHDPDGRLDAPSPGDRKQALAQYFRLAQNYKDYATKWGNGKEIVGVNNISEVFFEWGDKKSVRQETWWRLKGDGGSVLDLRPLSKFTVSLDFDDLAFPIPELPQQP